MSLNLGIRFCWQICQTSFSSYILVSYRFQCLSDKSQAIKLHLLNIMKNWARLHFTSLFRLCLSFTGEFESKYFYIVFSYAFNILTMLQGCGVAALNICKMLELNLNRNGKSVVVPKNVNNIVLSVLFVYVDALCSSQQVFIHVRTIFCLPGLNQYKAQDKVTTWCLQSLLLATPLS